MVLSVYALGFGIPALIELFTSLSNVASFLTLNICSGCFLSVL